MHDFPFIYKHILANINATFFRGKEVTNVLNTVPAVTFKVTGGRW